MSGSEDSPPEKGRKASMRCIPGLHTPSPAMESKRRVPSSASRLQTYEASLHCDSQSGDDELPLEPTRRTLLLTYDNDAVQNNSLAMRTVELADDCHTTDDDLPLVPFHQSRMLTMSNDVDVPGLLAEQQSPSSASSSQQDCDNPICRSASQSPSGDVAVQPSFRHLMLQAVEDNDGVSVSGTDNSQDDRHLPNLSYVTDGSHTDGEQELYMASLNSQASQLGFGTPLHHRRRERFR